VSLRSNHSPEVSGTHSRTTCLRPQQHNITTKKKWTWLHCGPPPQATKFATPFLMGMQRGSSRPQYSHTSVCILAHTLDKPTNGSASYPIKASLVSLGNFNELMYSRTSVPMCKISGISKSAFTETAQSLS